MSRWLHSLGPGSLLGSVRWLLGAEASETRQGGTGFGLDDLAPSRDRSLSERGVALLTALAASVSPWVVLGAAAEERRLPVGILAAAGLVWAARMALPPRLPMDRTALTLAAYTFAPWGVTLLALPRRLRLETLLEDTNWLLWQAGAVGAVAALGLARDIRSEMRRQG